MQRPESIRQQSREIAWLDRLARRNYDFSSVARYIGSAKSNLGPAYRYELVRDRDGQTSRSVAHYFNDASLHGTLSRLLGKLYRHVLEHRVAFYDLTSPNLLWQKVGDDDGRLVFVDGVGDPSSLRFLNTFESHFTQKVNRRFTRACRVIAVLANQESIHAS